MWRENRVNKYILVNYDNNINGDIKVKKAIYIIIFFSLLILPGCSLNDKKELENPEEILRSEQLEIFDAKIFAVLENVLGVHFANYRLVTVAQEKPNQEEGTSSAENAQQNQSEETAKDKNKSKTIKISELVDDNSIFEQDNKPNWENAKQYVSQASDIFVDIQIELKNQNISQEDIAKYGQYVSQLVDDVSSEDMEKTVKDIQQIYAQMYDIFTKSTTDEKLLSIKKLYYDAIQLVIILEQDNEEEFNKQLELAKEDINNLKIYIKQDNEKYLKERIDTLINNIDYSKKTDTRLKIVMLINCIPILEYYEYE